MTLSQRIRSYFNGDLTANIYEIIALIFEQQDGIAWQGGSVLSGATYTLSDADNGKILVSVSAPVTVVVPNTLTKGFSITLIQGEALAPITVSTSAPMILMGNPTVTVTSGEGSYFVFKMISTSPPVGLLTAGSGAGVPPPAFSISFQGEVTGTSPVVIGAVYLNAGTTLLAISSALLGTVSGGTATLRLIKQSNGAVLASWSVTGPVVAASLGIPVSVVSSDWYLFDLAGGGVGTISRAYGARLEV